jgi:hypothetical protein
MHGNEPDPAFCYAQPHRAASVGSDLGRIHPPAVAGLAEPLVQAERDRLLVRMRAHGFIDDHQGVRIAKDGKRFRIPGAVFKPYPS